MKPRRASMAAASLGVAALLVGCTDGPDKQSTGSSTTGPEVTSTSVDPGTEGATTVAPGVPNPGGPAGTAPRTTTSRPTPPVTVPSTVEVFDDEIRIRARVGSTDRAAGTITLAQPVAGYAVVMTGSSTRFSAAEGESSSLAALGPGDLLSITGKPAGAGRLAASEVVFLA